MEPASTMPSCSCGCRCRGTSACGARRTMLSIAPSPNSGYASTPSASRSARPSPSLRISVTAGAYPAPGRVVRLGRANRAYTAAHWARGAVGSAPGSHPGGRRFESARVHLVVRAQDVLASSKDMHALRRAMSELRSGNGDLQQPDRSRRPSRRDQQARTGHYQSARVDADADDRPHRVTARPCRPFFPHVLDCGLGLVGPRAGPLTGRRALGRRVGARPGPSRRTLLLAEDLPVQRCPLARGDLVLGQAPSAATLTRPLVSNNGGSGPSTWSRYCSRSRHWSIASRSTPAWISSGPRSPSLRGRAGPKPGSWGQAGIRDAAAAPLAEVVAVGSAAVGGTRGASEVARRSVPHSGASDSCVLWCTSTPASPWPTLPSARSTSVSRPMSSSSISVVGRRMPLSTSSWTCAISISRARARTSSARIAGLRARRRRPRRRRSGRRRAAEQPTAGRRHAAEAAPQRDSWAARRARRGDAESAQLTCASATIRPAAAPRQARAPPGRRVGLAALPGSHWRGRLLPAPRRRERVRLAPRCSLASGLGCARAEPRCSVPEPRT